MLKPYCKSKLTQEERIFNYRLSRARRVIENSFGILSAKWRIYKTAINASLTLTENIVKSTVCLHNWLRNHPEKRFVERTLIDLDIEGEVTPGQWRSEANNFSVLAPNNQNSTTAAKAMREKYTKYFSGSGAVEWQLSKI